MFTLYCSLFLLLLDAPVCVLYYYNTTSNVNRKPISCTRIKVQKTAIFGNWHDASTLCTCEHSAVHLKDIHVDVVEIVITFKTQLSFDLTVGIVSYKLSRDW